MKSILLRPARFACGQTLLAVFVALVWSVSRSPAAIPSPEKLLPDDTLLMVTVPDFARLQELCKTTPQIQFWNDPAMKPFRDNFISRLNAELVQPLERELGVKLANYTNLLQGQLTFALTQNGSPGAGGFSPGLLLLLDARDKSGQLKTNLDELRRKWVDAGKPLQTEKIRDIEFTIFQISEKDLPPSLNKIVSTSGDDSSGDDDTNKTSRTELVIGRFDSLLIIGNSTKAVEKIAVHLTGGAMPALGDLAVYEANRLAMFREAPFFGWVNVKSCLELLTHRPKESDTPDPLAMFDPDRIIGALGLGNLKSFAFNVQTSREGLSAQFSIGAPEAGRQGLLKLFPGEAKESGPPPFVPAEVVKFQRWRLDGQKAWATLQKMLAEISPQSAGVLDFMLNSAEALAKEKDPSFDIQKNLFGNLGDDFISYEKAAPGGALADLNSAPSLLLIGSPQPDQLAAALKTVLVLMNQSGSAPTEREFLGRKIYSLPAPASPLSAGDPKAGRATLSYASNGSYVALTTDATLLEEYLRSGENQQKSLRDTPGLTEAMARVGGSSTGWFSYENQAETTRTVFEALRKSTPTNQGPAMLAPGIPAYVPENPIKDWMDFSLLPPFEKVAKYFSYSVFAGSANADGLTFKLFAPAPPQLKK